MLVLLLKYAKNFGLVVLFDSGTGNKRRRLYIKQIIEVKGSDLCSVLPALHCFTGCDTVSSFVRRGKITPLKALQKYSDFIQVFECFGTEETCSETLLDDLEEFACRMYGQPSYTSVNKLRLIPFLRSIKEHQVRFSVPSMASILVFLLLAEHHWKSMLREPIIRHPSGAIPTNNFLIYRAQNDMPGKLMMKAHLILSGLVATLYHRN